MLKTRPCTVSRKGFSLKGNLKVITSFHLSECFMKSKSEPVHTYLFKLHFLTLRMLFDYEKKCFYYSSIDGDHHVKVVKRIRAK